MSMTHLSICVYDTFVSLLDHGKFMNMSSYSLMSS